MFFGLRMIRAGLAVLLRLVFFLGQAALIVLVTLILAGAFAARQRPDLEIWHTIELTSEFRAGAGIQTLDEYLEIERRVFEELTSKVVSVVEMGDGKELNRFSAGNRSFPELNGKNWNRTQVSEPAKIIGGVLMLHGMTDSPYSMRHFASLMYDKGYYVLNMRMPGHGTVPAGLATVGWRDWDAAIRIGAADVASKLTADQPFFIMGYSNGGSLALKYALDSIEDAGLRSPDRLILLSPMLGVSSLARFGKIYYWLGKIEFFRQALWLDVLPEFDPHKYNSFPMNALRQSMALTSTIDQQLRRMADSGSLDRMPPVLTFQSLVDATVLTGAIVNRLYHRLPANGSELVLFDINREGVLESLVNPRHDALLERLQQSGSLDYNLTLISNRRSRSEFVGAIIRYPQSQDLHYRELEHAWPEDLYSLSHVALPFPPDDEIYGFEEPAQETRFPRIGGAQMAGESGALIVPASLFTRVRSNPFHTYVERRIIEAVDSP